MTKTIWPVFLIVVGMLVWSCKEGKVDKEGYWKEKESKKLVRATDGEIAQYIIQSGERIAPLLPNDGDLTDATQAVLDSVGAIHKSVVDDSLAMMHSKIREVFDAYKYQLQQGQACENSIQKLGLDTIVYIVPNVHKSKLSLDLLYFTRKNVVLRLNKQDVAN